MNMTRINVLTDVDTERDRQDALWGIQRHEMGTWLKILIEEVGEVAQAMQAKEGWGKRSDANNLYEELIHVAAVTVAIAEQIKEAEVENEIRRN
jgi:NTP pyrophosphatase (non-canonical NTP hydrolase)